MADMKPEVKTMIKDTKALTCTDDVESYTESPIDDIVFLLGMFGTCIFSSIYPIDTM